MYATRRATQVARPTPQVLVLGIVCLPVAVSCDGDSKPTAPNRAPSSAASAVSGRASQGSEEAVPAASGSARAAAGTDPEPAASVPEDDAIRQQSLAEQRAHVLELLSRHAGVEKAARDRIAAIFEASDWLGLGNPRISRPALSRKECRARRARAPVRSATPRCNAANMVAVFNPAAGESAADATVCIDQFEFPNVECEFPVTWVRASEASAICRTLGKRLCDAHEWEGACAGALLEPQSEYAWDRVPRAYQRGMRRERRLSMEHLHNEARAVVWAYGDEQNHALCATGSRKQAKCAVVDYGTCATLSFPSGSFPECVSPFGVYDQHGNVAEHMSLPLFPEELGSRGGTGWTEMKGSWFIFAHEQTHPDDCRWRAKNWHTTRIDHWNSHRNYHLGFRCCRDL